MPILGLVTFFLHEILKKTLGCDTDLLIGFILAFESLTLDQCKYFLDFLRRTVWSEIFFVGYGASKLGNSTRFKNICENERMEVIYIYDLESIEMSILSQVILHTLTNTSHHKLYV